MDVRQAVEIRLDDVRKSYGPTRALQGLSLTLDSDSIIGIIGENGAGKSTFIRVLSGEEEHDGGEISKSGSPWSLEERRRNVAVVHQEADKALFPNLTVQENLLIGRDGLGRPKPDQRILDLIDELGLGRFQRRILGACPIVVRQLTEIARALLQDAEVFLFDEPNSALTEDESQELFGYMRTLHRNGRVVVLVSHRLNDIATLCGRVSVVVDGAVRSTLEGAAVTPHAMGTLLVGGAESRRRKSEAEPHSRQGRWPEVCTPIPGAVVAVTGPEGGGGREVVKQVGLVAKRKTADLVGASAYMPSDRKTSLFPNLSVGANIAIRMASESSGPRFFVTKKSLGKSSKQAIGDYGIKAASGAISVLTLSGGNQQKVALAAALATNARVLAIEEPTRGVDLKTKTEIYGMLRDFVAGDGAVVLYAPEMEDIVGCADVLYVIADGAVRGIIDVGSDSTPEALGGEVAHMLSQ